MTTNFEPNGNDIVGFYPITPDRRASSPLVGMWFTYRDLAGERVSGRIVDRLGDGPDHTYALFCVELFEVGPSDTIPRYVLLVIPMSEIIERGWRLYRSVTHLANDL